MPSQLALLQADVVSCRKCPRLVRHREAVARAKVRRFSSWRYWGRPVPSFGDPDARILVVGLAPAAHGANRTGRMFTGDRSGDFLFAAMHRAGLSNQATSVHRRDGLTLRCVTVTAAVRCAPPANRPSPIERRRCASYLRSEMQLLPGRRVIVALGRLAWQAVLEIGQGRGGFAHGARAALPGGGIVLGSYHPSQQNTFTGRLTPAMLDAILRRAMRLAGVSGPRRGKAACAPRRRARGAGPVP